MKSLTRLRSRYKQKLRKITGTPGCRHLSTIASFKTTWMPVNSDLCRLTLDNELIITLTPNFSAFSL